MNSIPLSQGNVDENNSHSINSLYAKANKSEKFQDAVNDMRLLIWKQFLLGVASNPNMTKKEICNHLGLKVGTIKSIQQYYKLQSPFYYNKPKTRRKVKKVDKPSDDAPVKPARGGKKKKQESDITGGTYNFDDVFDETVQSLSRTRLEKSIQKI